MSTKKLELAGLVSLAVFSIVAVGLATNARTGSADAVAQVTSITPPLISSAQASPIESANSAKTRAVAVDEPTPIYLDLGAKF